MMMSKDIITLLQILQLPWPKCTNEKHATKHVDVTSRTFANRRVGTAWPALRASAAVFATSSPNVTDILEAASVSRTERRAPKRKYQYVNESDFARLVDGS